MRMLFFMLEIIPHQNQPICALFSSVCLTTLFPIVLFMAGAGQTLLQWNFDTVCMHMLYLASTS